MLIKKIFILLSGNGSNFEAIVQKLHNREFMAGDTPFRIEVCGCLCNNPNGYGITRAKNLNIPCEVLSHRDFATREEYDTLLVQKIQSYAPNLCVLAGFMRILTPIFIKNIRSINIHPSLLPLFKGAHAIKESFYSNMKVGGVTIHWVSEELDSGEIIEQQCLQKKASWGLEEFESHIHAIEHELYPRVIVDILCKDIMDN